VPGSRVRRRAHPRGGVDPRATSSPSVLAGLPADTAVLASCRGGYGVLSYDAVRLLAARGHRAIRLVDGMLEWRLAGLCVDTAPTA